MLESFEECARNGADLLSIESTGGKELHDEALLNGDLLGVVYALGVLAPNDMNFIWKEIVKIGEKYDALAAGDTACGFSNTAMVLADKGMIPRVFAAVDRVASVVRSLQAYIQGAVGPSKDCAYEGPYIKAMTGVPISMEGKSSACAHLTHLGNIAGACCDLWSNESVQNVRLLSASAPIVSMEQLVYDCRLMNKAIEGGAEETLRLQRLMVDSDANLDPQAYILSPDVVVRLSEKMSQCDSPLAMTLCAVDETIGELERASEEGRITLNATEARWLGMLSAQRESIPDDEEMMLETLKMTNPELNFIPAEYGIE